MKDQYILDLGPRQPGKPPLETRPLLIAGFAVLVGLVLIVNEDFAPLGLFSGGAVIIAGGLIALINHRTLAAERQAKLEAEAKLRELIAASTTSANTDASEPGIR